MSETLRLLKYDPAVALLIMVNNHLNLHLREEFARAHSPQAMDEGTLTQVTVETFDSINDFIPRIYTGSFTYTYDRLSIEEVFGPLVLNLTPPVTVVGVMTELANASGMVFTEDDFENALVDTNSFTLTAKPGSLRWVGSTTVMLNEPGTAIELADAFPNTLLDGLYAPHFDAVTALETVIPVTELDGVTYSAPTG